ncbi:(2Fe-2S)-binding protein [Paenibacillus sp. LS1]|uniref:(2Fe-2S)-binding protein n=1 Tax=Paenibacillus sp. LS1 TaxID=2992120 RepID=UPI00222E47C4|nr:(2Fe-2S)-binding protein [Paenibacillus sp. LS1]MCW3792457.1 (2Fe-2S)-binding protein [Paenibacillus sp. LS1]
MSGTLQHFFVTTIRANGHDFKYPFHVKDLLDEEKRNSILREQAIQQGLRLGGKGSVAVGTLFAKRYSVFVMSVISAFSLYDIPLSIADDDVRFELNGAGGMRYETRLEKISLEGEKSVQRRSESTLLKKKMLLHLEPVLRAVADGTGASYNVMWSLVAHNVQQLYVRMVNDRKICKTDQRLAQIQEDQSIWLDEENKNAFTFAMKLHRFDHPEWQGTPLLIRRYCCLAYQVGDGGHAHGYCNSCPKLDSESRLRNLLQQ